MHNGYVLPLALILWAAPAVETSAQTSKDYALMGKRAWVAFECAALALTAKNETENRRLFTLGYEQGKAFVQALQSGKIEEQHLNSNVPMSVLFKLEGPNIDFMLGRIWEGAYEKATKAIHAADWDRWVSLAQNQFVKQNCGLM
jgi:hypothetical protein